MKTVSIIQKILSSLDDPATLWFKLQNRRMVAFSMCKNLRKYAYSIEGSEIRRIVDVGANVGQFAKMARYCWPVAFIESFEPDAAAAAAFRREHCNDGRIALHEHALGADPGELTIHYGETSEQNSAFIETHGRQRGVFQVQVLRLDDVVLRGDEGKQLLKLDVQGYEMQVLKGAEKTLKEVDFVLVELSLADTFEGGALIENVWAFLRQRGFTYRQILDCYRDTATDVILQMDILFGRKR